MTSKTTLTKLLDSHGTSTTSYSLTNSIQLSTHHEQYHAVHILPFFKAEVNKMIQNDIITEVTERPIRSTP